MLVSRFQEPKIACFARIAGVAWHFHTGQGEPTLMSGGSAQLPLSTFSTFSSLEIRTRNLRPPVLSPEPRLTQVGWTPPSKLSPKSLELGGGWTLRYNPLVLASLGSVLV